MIGGLLVARLYQLSLCVLDINNGFILTWGITTVDNVTLPITYKAWPVPVKAIVGDGNLSLQATDGLIYIRMTSLSVLYCPCYTHEMVYIIVGF